MIWIVLKVILGHKEWLMSCGLKSKASWTKQTIHFHGSKPIHKSLYLQQPSSSHVDWDSVLRLAGTSATCLDSAFTDSSEQFQEWSKVCQKKKKGGGEEAWRKEHEVQSSLHLTVHYIPAVWFLCFSLSTTTWLTWHRSF